MKRTRIRKSDIEIYDYIQRYKHLNDGNVPSRREIVENTCHPSTSTVTFSLRKLEKAGYLKLKHGEQHIEIIGGRWLGPPEYFIKPKIGELVKET